MMAISRHFLAPLMGLGPYDYGIMTYRYPMEFSNDLIGFTVIVGLGSTILAPGASQTLSFVFVPIAIGSRSSVLFLGEDTGGAPATVVLMGTGITGSPLPLPQGCR